ncbi:C40 family peptidase [Streptomyces sp. NPDC087300]|uniref:C40 family peptidase n=1 Tax=Streptomyces sp. NPDC087300 TaxID=3365780 RepID=UPI0037F9AE0F
MQTPRFTEEIPADCGCGHCAAPPSTAPEGPRCGVRGALVAAVGAAVLVGAAPGTAAAEPAPSHAGWDGSKYWYKDATGWWRWTSHHDKYLARTGKQATHQSAGRTRAQSHRTSTSEPVFRGRQGWDATDRVYWYKKAGHWYWTSHRDKYERHTGRSGGHASKPAPRPGGSGHASSGTPSRHGTEAAISYAMAHLGDPYVWGGNGPHGWDCSGLVMAAYRQAGVSLPRVADAQYRATRSISRGELRRGDLVFWSSNGSSSGIHHVAIYLGGGQYLEAPRPGKNVRVSSFAWYNPNMYGRVR